MAQQQPQQQQTYEVVVPEGVWPGREFAFKDVHGQTFRVRCPDHAGPGSKFCVRTSASNQAQSLPSASAFAVTTAAEPPLSLVGGATFPSLWRMPAAQMLAPTMFGQNSAQMQWVQQYNKWLHARQCELRRQRQNYLEGVQEDMQQLQEWQTEQYKQYVDMMEQLKEWGMSGWPGLPGSSEPFGQPQPDWFGLFGGGMGDLSWCQ